MCNTKIIHPKIYSYLYVHSIIHMICLIECTNSLLDDIVVRGSYELSSNKFVKPAYKLIKRAANTFNCVLKRT